MRWPEERGLKTLHDNFVLSLGNLSIISVANRRSKPFPLMGVLTIESNVRPLSLTLLLFNLY